jgi:hypothetical protein
MTTSPFCSLAVPPSPLMTFVCAVISVVGGGYVGINAVPVRIFERFENKSRQHERTKHKTIVPNMAVGTTIAAIL